MRFIEHPNPVPWHSALYQHISYLGSDDRVYMPAREINIACSTRSVLADVDTAFGEKSGRKRARTGELTFTRIFRRTATLDDGMDASRSEQNAEYSRDRRRAVVIAPATA